MLSISLYAAAWTILAVTGSGEGGLVDAEAVAGRPFGVGRITVDVPAADGHLAAHDLGQMVVERQGRVLYSAFSPGLIRRVLGGGQRPSSLTVFFLFTGQEPLELSVFTPTARTYVVRPTTGPPRIYNRLLRQWWREYHAAARRQQEGGDYPPIVQTYLTSMLSRRLGLEPPLVERVADRQSSNETRQTLELLMGLESLRLATLRATSETPDVSAEPAEFPVPDAPAWVPLAVPASLELPDIEPIAEHVPEECFYVRFGKFSNYLWLSRLLDQYGGELGSMITLRGHQTSAGDRFQNQLVLEQTTIGDLLGDQFISDVAIIGRDVYLDEGAAVGILFEARNSLLGGDFQRQRRAAAAREQAAGAALETVNIGGHDVSLLSTPDNRLRSYYAVDGKYHFFSTSRAMIERFFEAGRGVRPLAATDEFRFARELMPTSRNDTIFAYFSTRFFQELVGPQYQIELGRRMQALADMQLIKLAQLAAANERQPADTVADLVAAGLLPRGFGQRADGSGPILSDQGILDSMRGAVGTFTPIPDVPIQRVTRTEYSRYAARAAYYQNSWQQLDPLIVGLHRSSGAGGLDRITIDALVAPFSEGKYGWLTSMLGPPSDQRITRPPGSIISVQASLRGGLLFPSVPPHAMFVGVQDDVPLTDLRPDGLFKTLQILRTTPGYLGAWPKPGLLDMLPFGLAGEPDARGFSQMPLGLWRWQGRGFSVLSFDPGLLDTSQQHLDVEPAGDLAQIRVDIGDLSQARFASWLSAMNFERSRQASYGNARLMHVLAQQLGVPLADARAIAEDLVDGKLVCSLGGQYELVPHDGGIETWASTRWPAPGDPSIPADYRSPVLDWFRGLKSNLTKHPDLVEVHAELHMQRKASLLNLFGRD